MSFMTTEASEKASSDIKMIHGINRWGNEYCHLGMRGFCYTNKRSPGKLKNVFFRSYDTGRDVLVWYDECDNPTTVLEREGHEKGTWQPHPSPEYLLKQLRMIENPTNQHFKFEPYPHCVAFFADIVNRNLLMTNHGDDKEDQ